ncbi:diphthamide synthesis protein [Candidatus Woesearchaeota archaeon]|nr:diphthamide synthesis protein [Candidatus Woesearchaeota archaeon]
MIKVMHVHAKSTLDVRLPQGKLAMLPKQRWGVVTTIQHAHKIGDVLEQLRTAIIGGQVLGCNASEAEKIKDKVDAWLFVGSGEFHPIQVALKTGQEVWLWNPSTQELGLLSDKAAILHAGRKAGELSKYLHAKRVGIIVSTKIGQKNLVRAFELAKNVDKEYYIFACDELDMRQFENFSFIDFWVNTACPRIADERTAMVNIDDLIDAGILKLEKEPMAYEVPIWKSKMGLGK